MATSGVAGEIHEVSVFMRQENQTVMNVVYFELTAPIEDLEVRLLRALLECYLTNLIPVAGSNLQMVKLQGKRVTPTLGPIYEIGTEEGDDIQGEASGDTLPSHVSVCANIHTTRGGRSGRGRLFIPGIPEGATTGSFIGTAQPFWLALLAFATCVAGKFIANSPDVDQDDIKLGVLSRKLAGVNKPPYPYAAFARATKIVFRNQLGSTNSRKVGRGI